MQTQKKHQINNCFNCAYGWKVREYNSINMLGRSNLAAVPRGKKNIPPEISDAVVEAQRHKTYKGSAERSNPITLVLFRHFPTCLTLFKSPKVRVRTVNLGSHRARKKSSKN
jgi:hypothetical protein